MIAAAGSLPPTSQTVRHRQQTPKRSVITPSSEVPIRLEVCDEIVRRILRSDSNLLWNQSRSSEAWQDVYTRLSKGWVTSTPLRSTEVSETSLLLLTPVEIGYVFACLQCAFPSSGACPSGFESLE